MATVELLGADATANSASTPAPKAQAQADPRALRALTRSVFRSSRGPSAVLAAIVLLALSIWIAVEIVLSIVRERTGLHAGPLLVDPATAPESARDAIAQLTEQPLVVWVSLVASALVIIGIWFVLAGLLPARKPVRQLESADALVVTDDRVVARFLANVAARAARVPRSQVRAWVGQRSASVSIIPSSGYAVDTAAVRAALERELAGARFTQTPSVRVTVAETGTVK